MKRYVIEMANDFEKRVKPDKVIEIIKIRNAYISGIVTEIEAINAMLTTLNKED